MSKGRRYVHHTRKPQPPGLAYSPGEHPSGPCSFWGRKCVHPVMGKVVYLAHDMDVEVLAFVENMAYFNAR